MSKVNKSTVFEWVAEAHKNTGQGLTAIVVLGRIPQMRQLLNSLEEEGVIVKKKMLSSSFGAYESQFSYFVTGYYNIVDDALQNGLDEMDYLNYVRMYLGCLEEDETRKNIQKWINPTTRMLIQDEEFMSGYSEWLNRNSISLKEMTSMSTVYNGKDFCFNDKELKYIFELSSYQNNLIINDAIKRLNEHQSLNKSKIKLTDDIIRLYERKGNSEKEIEQYKKEQEQEKFESKTIEKVLFWVDCGDIDVNKNFKDEFDKSITDEQSEVV